MTARALLESIRILDGRVQRRAQDIERYMAMLTRITAPMDKDIVQGSTPDDGAVWDCLIEARAAYDSAVDEYNNRRQQVMEVIDQMDDPMLAQLLWDKYMCEDDPTFQELAQQYQYSESGIRRVLERAERYFANLSEKYRKVQGSTEKCG